MKPTTVFATFGIDAAPADHDIQVAPGTRQLILDVLELKGGTSPTVQVTAKELFPSTREIQIVSVDIEAVDTFTAGRTIRGRQSGKHATAISHRTASGKTYLAFNDTGPSNFFVGETLEERNLTGTDTAALAIVDSLPTQTYITGDQIADTTAVGVDTATGIAEATQAAPRPYKARKVRLSFAISGGPTSASFVVRVA